MSSPRLIAFFSLLAIAAAPGVVVNIDFSALATSADRYEGLAAAPDPEGAGAAWNNIVGSAGSLAAGALVDSTGVPTGWSIGISGFLDTRKSASEQEILESGIGGGPYTRLMQDYLRIDSGANTSVAVATGVIGGLTPGGSYDIYFYGQGSDMTGTDASSSGENSLFTVNSDPAQTGWDGLEGGDRNLVEGMEYVKFTATADAGGNISFTWANVVAGVNAVTDKVPSNTGTGSRFAALNGIQIMDSVPEPSAALLACGGCLLLFRRRRPAGEEHLT